MYLLKLFCGFSIVLLKFVQAYITTYVNLLLLYGSHTVYTQGNKIAYRTCKIAFKILVFECTHVTQFDKTVDLGTTALL